MPKLVLFFLLFLVSAVGVPPQSSAQTAEQAVRIDEIAVTGNRRVAVGTVLSYLPLRVGDRVSRSSLASLSSAFSKRSFSRISTLKSTARCCVSVVENPIINRVNIEGNDALDDENFSRLSTSSRAASTRASLRSRPASACWKSIRRPEDMRRSSTRRSSNLTRTGSISPSWSMKDR